MLASKAIAVALIVVVATGSIPSVAAETADRAGELEALMRRAEFEAAEAHAESLLHSGSLTRAEAARAYLALGVVASARRAVGKAEPAFRRALTLEPDLALPAWVGPHVVASFEAARAALRSSPAPTPPRIRLVPISGAPRLRIWIDGRGDGPVHRVVVRVAGVREVHDLGTEATTHEMPLPPRLAGCANATAGFADEYGNELWPLVASTEVCRPTPAAPCVTQTPAPEPPRSTFRSPERAMWTAGALTGGLVLTAGVLGWVALERRHEYHQSLDAMATVGEQQRLMEHASTAEQRATFVAVAAGVLAVATTVLYFIRRR